MRACRIDNSRDRSPTQKAKRSLKRPEKATFECSPHTPTRGIHWRTGPTKAGMRCMKPRPWARPRLWSGSSSGALLTLSWFHRCSTHETRCVLCGAVHCGQPGVCPLFLLFVCLFVLFGVPGLACFCVAQTTPCWIAAPCLCAAVFVLSRCAPPKPFHLRACRM